LQQQRHPLHDTDLSVTGLRISFRIFSMLL
jgi:hypothetical protein